MSDPISKGKICSLNPPEKLPLPPRQWRFALRASYYDGARDDAYRNVADTKYDDRHDYLMRINAAYRTLHYISLIFGAHDERTPEPYRGGLKRTLKR